MTDRRIFRYKYAVHDANDLDDLTDRFDLVSHCDAENLWSEDARRWDCQFVAQEAAEDFHRNHDGWEWSFPITLSIFRTDGIPLGVFEVEREVVPEFHAREVNG